MASRNKYVNIVEAMRCWDQAQVGPMHFLVGVSHGAAPVADRAPKSLLINLPGEAPIFASPTCKAPRRRGRPAFPARRIQDNMTSWTWYESRPQAEASKALAEWDRTLGLLYKKKEWEGHRLCPQQHTASANVPSMCPQIPTLFDAPLSSLGLRRLLGWENARLSFSFQLNMTDMSFKAKNGILRKTWVHSGDWNPSTNPLTLCIHQDFPRQAHHDTTPASCLQSRINKR